MPTEEGDTEMHDDDGRTEQGCVMLSGILTGEFIMGWNIVVSSIICVVMMTQFMVRKLMRCGAKEIREKICTHPVCGIKWCHPTTQVGSIL